MVTWLRMIHYKNHIDGPIMRILKRRQVPLNVCGPAITLPPNPPEYEEKPRADLMENISESCKWLTSLLCDAELMKDLKHIDFRQFI